MANSIHSVALAVLIIGSSACDKPGDLVSPYEATFSAVARTQGRTLAEARAGTASYHNVNAALEDGYVRVTACIYNTPGGRGHIFANFSLIDGIVDPAQPELLVYEPTRSGRYRLVAVGFLVPAPAWDPFHAEPPSLGEQEFVDRRTPPFGAEFPNYALFAWLWRHNPDGMYAFYNPQVSCEYADVAEVR
jgi:hypothetical protein